MILGTSIAEAAMVIALLILVKTAGLTNWRRRPAATGVPVFGRRIENYAVAVFLLAFGCFVMYYLQPGLVKAPSTIESTGGNSKADTGGGGSVGSESASSGEIQGSGFGGGSSGWTSPEPGKSTTSGKKGSDTAPTLDSSGAKWFTSGPNPPGITDEQAKPPAPSSGSSFPWSITLISVFAAGIVLILYGFGRKRFWAKAAGGLAITGSLFGSGPITLFKVDKLENNFKTEKIASVDVEIKLQKRGGFSPAHIMRLEGFCTSTAELREDIPALIQGSCKEHELSKKRAFLLVVGATDNAPLRGGRFESNFSLARGRAERVREILIAKECDIPADRIVALVSGPRHSGTSKDNPPQNSGNEQDRSVDVWAFWDNPLMEEATPKALTPFTSVGAIGKQQSCTKPPRQTRQKEPRKAKKATEA